MKYYYLNKIVMAVLVALLLFFGTRTLIDIAYQEHPPEKPGYEVAGTEEKPEGKEEKPAGSEMIAALQTADPAQGEQDAALCKVCHSFDKGGPTMIGPNLYGIVGMKVASHEGVNYTPALKQHEDQEWTFENLDVWLTNPQAFASGTSMAFPGIPDLKKRANVIAYLNKNSDNPLPIPEPKAEEAAPAAADEEPADKEAAGKPEILTLMASADPAKGQAAAALCMVCHTVDKDGATLIGPNLYNIVGNKVAANEGFTYSPALKKHEGQEWTYETLDAWLAGPQAFAPGTTMAFPGIPEAAKRADVIAFLRSKSDDPIPLPEAAAAPAEEPAAEEPAAEEPAEGPAAEGPAAEEPAAEEPAEEPAAEEPAEEPAAEEPEAVMEEETMEETIVVPPTVSEDAPSEPHQGEPASESQPQPVQPESEPDNAAADDAMDEAADEAVMEEMDEIIVVPPTVSEDAPSEPHQGEPASESQPQPVYPDGEPEEE